MLRTDLFLAHALIERPVAIVIGDSRVDQAVDPAPGVLKVGYGGAPLRDLIGLARTLCFVARPASIVVAAGINDARDPRMRAEAFVRDAALMMTICPGARMTVMGVWPGETDRPPLGATTPINRIVLINRLLRQVSSERRARFIPPPSRVIATQDGVHFAPAENRRWSRLLWQAALASNPHPPLDSMSPPTA
ncbi:hypothetical protein [Sphingomonas sp.]|uniref:hypothetical protein n=1 Tax=Sphingomonas sp. TaxID=28214 RepID=UPI002D7FC0DA|nr:hypothetical protein [Sphingomonas sp.]HEU0043274.1 hypothetical protein [Sphingomonas sp.]